MVRGQNKEAVATKHRGKSGGERKALQKQIVREAQGVRRPKMKQKRREKSEQLSRAMRITGPSVLGQGGAAFVRRFTKDDAALFKYAHMLSNVMTAPPARLPRTLGDDMVNTDLYVIEVESQFTCNAAGFGFVLFPAHNWIRSSTTALQPRDPSVDGYSYLGTGANGYLSYTSSTSWAGATTPALNAIPNPEAGATAGLYGAICPSLGAIVGQNTNTRLLAFGAGISPTGSFNTDTGVVCAIAAKDSDNQNLDAAFGTQTMLAATYGAIASASDDLYYKVEIPVASLAADERSGGWLYATPPPTGTVARRMYPLTNAAGASITTGNKSIRACHLGFVVDGCPSVTFRYHARFVMELQRPASYLYRESEDYNATITPGRVENAFERAIGPELERQHTTTAAVRNPEKVMNHVVPALAKAEADASGMSGPATKSWLQSAGDWIGDNWKGILTTAASVIPAFL